MRSRS
ncbi:MAG: hypothetical protein EZS28_055128, partial [Streblomastix strix]|jgi:hypothetical protein